MLFIVTVLFCCGEYKGVGKGPGQKAGGIPCGRGQSLGSNFFCRTVQWGIDRRDW